MVNMTDFNNKEHSLNVTKSIFNRQKELMAKYEGIEAKNGLLETPDVPVDIDSYKGQARLKNFAWRVTEELTEALERFSSLVVAVMASVYDRPPFLWALKAL